MIDQSGGVSQLLTLAGVRGESLQLSRPGRTLRRRIRTAARGSKKTDKITDTDEPDRYIAPDNEGKWQLIVAGEEAVEIEDLREMVVIAAQVPAGRGFRVVEPGGTLLQLSAGQPHRQKWEGVKAVTVESGEAPDSDGELQLDLQQHISPSRLRSARVVGGRGQLVGLRDKGRLILSEDEVSYVAGEERVSPVYGLLLDPPQTTITDVYHRAVGAIEAGENILLILVDGLGYHQYLHAIQAGRAPFMGSLQDPERVLSAYPPITLVNVAAALTGELPHINGVYDRGMRQPDVPTIFDTAEENDWRAAALLGPVAPVSLERNAVLHTPNEDGSADKKVLDTARQKLSGEYRLLLVHFKDVDRAGHTYGDTAQQTMREIETIDGYLRRLVDGWSGQVIIFSDHGMHSTEEGGDHGALLADDMITPFWMLDGGLRDE